MGWDDFYGQQGQYRRKYHFSEDTRLKIRKSLGDEIHDFRKGLEDSVHDFDFYLTKAGICLGIGFVLMGLGFGAYLVHSLFEMSKNL